MTTSGVAAWALSYAAVGWRVFPANGKHPAFTGWQQAATTDPHLIRAWWPTDAWATNVGAITGELFDVFDVEVDHLPAFTDWMRAGSHSLPMTPVARSGRGGLHILTAPVGVDGSRKLVLDGVHIGELKSVGGLALLCPSVTVGQYTWRFAPAGMAVAAAPEWLRGLVAERPPLVERTPATTTEDALQRLENLAQAVVRTDPGNRNNVLFWAACRAVEEGIPVHAAARALSRAAADAGLGRVETERTLRSAFESAS